MRALRQRLIGYLVVRTAQVQFQAVRRFGDDLSKNGNPRSADSYWHGLRSRGGEGGGGAYSTLRERCRMPIGNSGVGSVVSHNRKSG